MAGAAESLLSKVGQGCENERQAPSLPAWLGTKSPLNAGLQWAGSMQVT